jgi:hypothetical protein
VLNRERHNQGTHLLRITKRHFFSTHHLSNCTCKALVNTNGLNYESPQPRKSCLFISNDLFSSLYTSTLLHTQQALVLLVDTETWLRSRLLSNKSYENAHTTNPSYPVLKSSPRRPKIQSLQHREVVDAQLPSREEVAAHPPYIPAPPSPPTPTCLPLTPPAPPP